MINMITIQIIHTLSNTMHSFMYWMLSCLLLATFEKETSGQNYILDAEVSTTLIPVHLPRKFKLKFNFNIDKQ